MNKNVSQEIIEVGGKEYTLFMNRTGIIAWEKVSKVSEFGRLVQKKYGSDEETTKEEVKITNDTNPFEMFGNSDEFDKDMEKLTESLVTFYWIALYTNYKMNMDEAKKWYDLAVNGNGEDDGYGEMQMIQLCYQIINNVNNNSLTTKKLKALKPMEM